MDSFNIIANQLVKKRFDRPLRPASKVHYKVKERVLKILRVLRRIFHYALSISTILRSIYSGETAPLNLCLEQCVTTLKLIYVFPLFLLQKNGKLVGWNSTLYSHLCTVCTCRVTNRYLKITTFMCIKEISTHSKICIVTTNSALVTVLYYFCSYVLFSRETFKKRHNNSRWLPIACTKTTYRQ